MSKFALLEEYVTIEPGGDIRKKHVIRSVVVSIEKTAHSK
jgi:hypothetical protein